MKTATIYWTIGILVVIGIILVIVNNSKKKNNSVSGLRQNGCKDGSVLSCVCQNKLGLSTGGGIRTCIGGEWGECDCSNNNRTVPIYINPMPRPRPTPRRG